MLRLTAAAKAHGGVAGPAFVVYHGEVNEDGDGPVEVCVPIDVAHQDASDTAMRREAAHDEAYVRLKKAQVEFPQILTAYDAVAQWIGANGRTHSGPPGGRGLRRRLPRALRRKPEPRLSSGRRVWLRRDAQMGTAAGERGA
jgi:hypothetical protein